MKFGEYYGHQFRALTLADLASEAKWKVVRDDAVEQHSMPLNVDLKQFLKRWTAVHIMGLGHGVVAERDDWWNGMLLFGVNRNIWDGEKEATEQFRWVKKGVGPIGLKLLEVFETYAKILGCKRVFIGSLEWLDSDLQKIYIRKGYKAVEKRYMKEFSNGT